MPFELYTRYYDLLNRDKDYAAEAAYIAGHIRRRTPDAKRILELGCGTGGHAEHLARLGFEVLGVDMSTGMLERAHQRRASLPADIRARLSYAEGDARTVRTGQLHDTVISLFHVMSYQTSDADLRAAHDTAAAHLSAGGLFLYDYWYGPAVLTQRPTERVRRLADEAIKVTRIAQPELHHARNVCDVNYTLFVENLASGQLQQFQEKHPMRYLFLPELQRLEGHEWNRSQDLAWMTDHAPSLDQWGALRILARA
jgi:SAM-dependent methyltransferase